MSDEASSFWTVPPWPEFGLASDIRPALGRALAAGRASVLVSLHAVEGAAPLGEGAQMLFDQGAAAGFLSGGCVEGDVALHAQAASWRTAGRDGWSTGAADRPISSCCAARASCFCWNGSIRRTGPPGA